MGLTPMERPPQPFQIFPPNGLDTIVSSDIETLSCKFSVVKPDQSLPFHDSMHITTTHKLKVIATVEEGQEAGSRTELLQCLRVEYQPELWTNGPSPYLRAP